MVKEKIQVKSPEEELVEKVKELKKKESKEELLEIVQIQPFNHEIQGLIAARKALDELGVKYLMTFKIQCEQRAIGAAFGKKGVEKPEEETQGSKELPGVPNDITEEEAKKADEDSEEKPKETKKPVKKPTKTSKKKQK